VSFFLVWSQTLPPGNHCADADMKEMNQVSGLCELAVKLGDSEKPARKWMAENRQHCTENAKGEAERGSG
jgi:hypothetical protein